MIHTKELLQQTLWELLEEKPYNKITVRDFSERLQMSRNTFYYHYHDIPLLLESMMKDWSDELMEANYVSGDPLTLIESYIRAFQGRRKALLHIYRSVQREVLQEHMKNLCAYIASQHIARELEDYPLSEADRILLQGFYRNVMFGVATDWLARGLPQTMQAEAERIIAAFRGSSRHALTYLSENPK